MSKKKKPKNSFIDIFYSMGIKSLCKDHWLDILIIGAFAVLSFTFLTKSPLHPWNKCDVGTDSSVFKTVAFMMEKGFVPYKSSFDHKGPIIYIINYFGNLISPYRGVWVFEFISLFCTIVINYFCLRKILKINRILSTIAVFSGISLLFSYFDGGNLTEEYAMPFISIGNYVFLTFFMNNKCSPLKLCACGFSFAVVLFLRVNMVAMWGVFCLAILIILLAKNNIKELLIYTGWFMVGVCVVVAPIICWLGINDALKDFWFDYIQFNLVYSSSEGGRATFAAQWDSFYVFFNTTIFAISFMSTIFLTIKSKRPLWILYAFMMISNLILICISGMQYPHYGMILIPIVIIPIGGMISFLSEYSKNQPIGAYLFAGFLLCSFIWSDWVSVINITGKTFISRKEDHISADVRNMAELIKSNTSANDAISVYGNRDVLYVVSERVHATKYSYQFPIGTVYPAIIEEYWQELHEELPQIIVITQGHYDEFVKSFFESEHYELLWAEDNDIINNGNSMFKKI